MVVQPRILSARSVGAGCRRLLEHAVRRGTTNIAHAHRFSPVSVATVVATPCSRPPLVARALPLGSTKDGPFSLLLPMVPFLLLPRARVAVAASFGRHAAAVPPAGGLMSDAETPRRTGKAPAVGIGRMTNRRRVEHAGRRRRRPVVGALLENAVFSRSQERRGGGRVQGREHRG